MVAILLSGGPRAERLREVLVSSHEAEGRAWQRLERLTGKEPEMLGPDDLAMMRQAIDQGRAAEAERESAIREILAREERHDQEAGGGGDSYG